MITDSMTYFKIVQTGLLMAFFFILPACDLYEESWSTTERTQVEQERYYETFETQAITPALIQGISRDYARFGGDGLSISVTYDPASQSYTAMNASNDMARIAEIFRAQGVKDLNINLMPSPTYTRQTIVSYTAYKAVAPENCGTIPGYAHGDDVGYSMEKTDDDDQYKLGCSIQGLFAQQISRPKDLLGNTQTQTMSDGRRIVNATGVYRDGIANESLEGETATDE